jgi:hypothetical protein
LAVLLLVGSGAIIAALTAGPFILPVLVALVWALAEHFTLKRRLMLTSHLLLALFIVFWTCTVFGVTLLLPGDDWATATNPQSTLAVISPLRGLVTAAGAFLGCLAFWYRFRLPLAYAAGTVAAINMAVHILRILVPAPPEWIVTSVLLLAGFLTLALALWWDMTDIRRQTVRSQVGFWLHAAAGFQIAGASFRAIIGLRSSSDGWERLYSTAIATPTADTAVATIALAGLFCIFALAVDRRSILMSSLAFVFPALAQMLGGASLFAWLLSAMCVGGVLLLLATGWTQMRRAIVHRLPPLLQAQLPRTGLGSTGPRPVY